MKAINNLEELLEAIKKIMEVRFLPEGRYYVDKLRHGGQTSVCVHLIYTTPEEEDDEP